MKGGRVKRSLEAMHHSGEILHHTLWSASLKQSWGGMMYTPEEFSTGMGFLKLLFRLKGTVLPAVFTSGFFWCVIIIHLLLQGLQHLLHNWEDYTEGYLWTGITGAHPGIDSLPEVNWKVATVSLSLLIFFMVFYINSQYARFMSLYERTVALGGTMMEWAMLVKMYLPEDETGNRRWNAVRYMLASMHLLYYTLHETGGVGPAIEDAEWDATLAWRHGRERGARAAWRGQRHGYELAGGGCGRAGVCRDRQARKEMRGDGDVTWGEEGGAHA